MCAYLSTVLRYSILTVFGTCQQILLHNPYIKCYKNPFRGSHFVYCELEGIRGQRLSQENMYMTAHIRISWFCR
jgi:hypothetical protein